MNKFHIAAIVVTAAMALQAAESGDVVVVVYNSRVRESQEVARHYAALRHVPSRQVIGFNLPIGEDMTRDEYRDELQTPLVQFLEKEKLFVFKPPPDPASSNASRLQLKESKIRYAVLCYGVPLRILDDPNLSEPWVTNADPSRRGFNGAAVDSELTLLPWSHQRVTLGGFLQNPCYGFTNGAAIKPANGALIVARLDGPTPEIAFHLVDKALEAETNGLWGRAYFDLRGITNGDYKTADDWFRAGAEAARRYGFETIVDEKPETFSAAFPMSQIALYAGWYDANVSGPFTRKEVEFMPGAFAYHLHSFSAHTLRSETQYWCGPLLAKGVTATMGCIDEPYLLGTPDMQIFFTRWLLLGFSFGEAACASQRAVSWQTTVIGDPLYRPFAKSGQALQAELIKRHSKWIDWSDLRWVDLNLAAGGSVAEFTRYLENEPLTRQSAVLTEKLADLYQSQDKSDLAIKSFRQALELHPSPQQTVRLTLALGDQLLTSNQPAEALKVYENFLKHSSDYPDALSLWEKMEALAGKVGDTNAASRYAEQIKNLSTPR